MTQPDSQTHPSPRNVAVHVGAALILLSFFLPWFQYDSKPFTGLQLVTEARIFGFLIVPLAALVVLLFSIFARRITFFSRIAVLLIGLILSIGAANLALQHYSGAAPALWFTLSGGLLIAVGSAFDLANRV